MAYRYNTNRLDVEFRKRIQGLVDDTTPQLGGHLDLNGYGFVAVLTAGETLADGDVCYLNTSGKMVKADASDATTSNVLMAICTEALVLDDTGTFLLKGFYDTSGLSPGTQLYLSTTAGVLTTAVPTGSGEIVKVLGYAVTADQLFFDPDKTWIELE